MRIETNSAVQRPAARPASAARGAGFAGMIGTAETAAATISAPVGLAAGVFGIEGDADAATGRSRGLAFGHDLVDELEGLRRALLVGGVAGSRLARIAGKLDRLPMVADPALAGIVDEIRLRVAVEIAKLSPAHIAACRSLAREV